MRHFGNPSTNVVIQSKREKHEESLKKGIFSVIHNLGWTNSLTEEGRSSSARREEGN